MGLRWARLEVMMKKLFLLICLLLSAQISAAEYEKVLFYAKGLGKQYELRAVCLKFTQDHCIRMELFHDTVRKGNRVKSKLIKDQDKWMGTYLKKIERHSDVNVAQTTFAATYWSWKWAYFGPGILLPVTPFIDLVKLPYALPMALIRKKYRSQMYLKIIEQIDDFFHLRVKKPLKLRLRYYKDINL